MLLLGAVAVLASQRREGEERTGRIAVAVICTHAVVVMGISYSDVTYRNAEQRLGDAGPAARAVCAQPDADDATEVRLQTHQVRVVQEADLTCADL